jgi:hypothetical protein
LVGCWWLVCFEIKILLVGGRPLSWWRLDVRWCKRHLHHAHLQLLMLRCVCCKHDF